MQTITDLDDEYKRRLRSPRPATNDEIDRALCGHARLICGFANKLARTRMVWVERAWKRDYRVRLCDPWEDHHDLVRIHQYSSGVYRVRLNDGCSYRFKLKVTLDELPLAVAWTLGCYERESRGVTTHPPPPISLDRHEGAISGHGHYLESRAACYVSKTPHV